MRYWLLLLAGCGGAPTDTDTNTTQTGYGTPTLELTVNGVHAGPAAPNANSFVDLINQRDSTDSLKRSSLQIVASSLAANASCSLSADRYGEFVTSFGVGQYSLGGSGLGGTGDGAAAPVGAPTVANSEGLWSCNGSACANVGLSIRWIDASHVEGFFSGTFSGSTGAADVVCSFYLPTRTFRP